MPRLSAAGPILSCIALSVVFASALPASAQPRPGTPAAQELRRFKRLRVPPRAPADTDVTDTDSRRARGLVALFLGSGQRQRYTAEQTTRILDGMVQETQQLVKWGGAGRQRIEYISPARFKGEIMLINGGRLLNYKPAPVHKVFIGPVPPEEFASRVRELNIAIRDGRIRVALIGSENVAGRMAGIVEIRPPRPNAPFKRLWIDEKTGVRLRNETISPRGATVNTSYFTRIDYDVDLLPRDFGPDSLPSAPYEAILPKSSPLASVQSAQEQCAFTIREPAVPDGYGLAGAWVVRAAARTTVILRYTDGLNFLTLFQSSLVRRPASPLAQPAKLRGGVAHWAAEDRLYTLIGNPRADAFNRLAESLK